MEAGDLCMELAILIGNNSTAHAFERARNHGIAALHIPPSRYSDESTYAEYVLSVLRDYKIDIIALAGYMKKIPRSIVNAYANRIVNIHPALLPAFGGPGLYGEKVHHAVIDYGAKISGITVHFVDEEYDHGPVIYQEALPVLDSDDALSLAKRVLALEHANYWRVLQAIAKGAITVRSRRVFGHV
jgi:phosphoribosylglycinamide formyltransferase-1